MYRPARLEAAGKRYSNVASEYHLQSWGRGRGLGLGGSLRW